MALSKWIPDRKVLAGGIAGVVAFFAATALKLDPEVAASAAGGIWALVQYFLPASAKDIVGKIEDTMRKLGVDPNQDGAVATAKAKAGVV